MSQYRYANAYSNFDDWISLISCNRNPTTSNAIFTEGKLMEPLIYHFWMKSEIL